MAVAHVYLLAQEGLYLLHSMTNAEICSMVRGAIDPGITFTIKKYKNQEITVV
jgi:hypothetical protein